MNEKLKAQNAKNILKAKTLIFFFFLKYTHTSTRVTLNG